MGKKLTLAQYKEQINNEDVICIAEVYTNAHTQILHQCKNNSSHKWPAAPTHIKRGKGCPYCAGNIKLTLDEYKEQIKDRGVTCTAGEYLGTHKPIMHQCKNNSGHKWLISPSHVKHGCGCPYCAGSVKLTLEEYKEQIKNKNAVCVAEKYYGTDVPIMHQCRKNPNHKWLVSPNSFKQGHGCPHCAGNVKPTIDQYKEQIKSKDVICVAEEYIDAHKPIMHQCKKDSSHFWMVSPDNIKRNKGCPHCNDLKQEPLCRTFLEKFFKKPFPKSRPKWLRNNGQMELDCFCEELGIAVEYNGKQHYEYYERFHKTIKDFEDQQRRDALKAKLCNEHGVELIIVPYYEKNISVYLEDYFASYYMAY
jgi:hypothetical protein